MNALRRGLTARVVVLPTEDMAAYSTFSTEIVERQFAQTAARAFRDESKSFVNLSNCEQRLHRTMKDAIRHRLHDAPPSRARFPRG
jgi:hypothetical protein